MTGRGAWTKRGMPANGTGYYQLLVPVNVGSEANVDQDHRAVNYGVRAIQQRINELGAQSPPLLVDGWLGPQTNQAVLRTQKALGVAVDGQVGPHTMTRLLWPVIQDIGMARGYPVDVIHSVGGICAHESGYDPGAVGFQDPDDIGLVQINGPANPRMTEADRFDYHIAFGYALDRIAAAFATYKKLDPTICSYASPVWGAEWNRTGQAPNPAMQAYVTFVKGWTP